MKIIIILFTILSLGCTSEILKPIDYKIIDTLHISKNGFGMVLGYDVIIKYDSSFYYGTIDYNGKLSDIKFKPLNLKKYK